jgi:hypothetical protein
MGRNTTNDGGLVMVVKDIEFLDRTLVLASSTPPVVGERRGGPDRRIGKDRRRADRSLVARRTGTDLEYTTPWQLPPGDTGG